MIETAATRRLWYSWRLPILAGIALSLVLLAGAGCGRSSPSAIEKLSPCTIEQGPADGYCGKLPVFENRAKGEGRKIELKIVVMPALRRDPRPDPLFVFAGGPGQGAAKIHKAVLPMFRRVQNDRDIVLIDQRGTGDSHPLNCEAPEEDRDNLDRFDEARSDALRKCLAGYDADPRFYITSVAMDDIDEVRRYLGYGQINLWGASYGTRAALTYLRRHGDTVRTVILDGVAPPDMALPLHTAEDSQRSLDLLISDCEKAPRCAARFPALRRNLDRVFAQLEGGKSVSIVHPRTGKRSSPKLTRAMVAGILMRILYAPSVSALLPHLIEEAAAGDFQGLLASAFVFEGADGGMNLSQGMFYSVICSEDYPRIGKDAIRGATERTYIPPKVLQQMLEPCEFWPRGEVKEEYYAPVISSKPVLILSGELDPVTPPSWGDRIAKHLANSRHFTIPGTGHGASGVGCVPKLIDRFLRDANPAALDGACTKKRTRPAFFLDHAGPGAGEAP